ncbi:MAG: hypothetical protein OXP68_07765 [Anaerolineaceae bacterium]|nr:hypothetical protein [Anaerolineaceae bacterium]MDE0329983.1 hypothetical protein [Anaerolineaceae bacterium]
MSDLQTLYHLFLQLANETLTAVIVIVATSLLLYNLSNELHDRVTRVSSVLLACVTAAYVADVFVSLQPEQVVYELALRLQWLGIAFVPTALYHLSDALLATTGLPSRGRRRRAIRLLYALGLLFLLMALFSNTLIQTEGSGPHTRVRAGVLFPFYILYFALITVYALLNVSRARQRCLTPKSRQRMGFLLLAMPTPALGLFPWSVVLAREADPALLQLTLINFSNVIVVLMLLFLAWPLTFFGSRRPESQIKLGLLRAFLRGPASATLALVIILNMGPAIEVLGLPGQEFMPFAVVAAILIWQWFIHLFLPAIENLLIYTAEDEEFPQRLRNLDEQLLTRKDFESLLEANLATICDNLRVSAAFVLSSVPARPELVASVGVQQDLLDQPEQFLSRLQASPVASDGRASELQKHGNYWYVPLYSERMLNSAAMPVGLLGIRGREDDPEFGAEEMQTLDVFVGRIARALDDMALQDEFSAALEGLLPQLGMPRQSDARSLPFASRPTPGEGEPVNQERFNELVRAALRHYWGGPGLTHSNLLALQVVQEAMREEQGPANALRVVLRQAIEQLRPEGKQGMTSPEWTLYNILEQRFLERRRVREVAARLALSEADLYRKQRIAIEEVATALLSMEQQCRDR